MNAPAKEDRSDRRRRFFQKGHRGERFAALALQLKGYRILATRFRTKGGEIDLIARRGDLVAFVEVKARPTLGEAMDAVGPSAQRRIEAAADRWLSKQADYGRLSARFDIVAVLPRRWPAHVPNAWQAHR